MSTVFSSKLCFYSQIYQYAIVDDTLNEYLGVYDIVVNDVDNFALFTFKFYSSCGTYKRHCGIENISNSVRI
jgi:hypothetical protein